MPGNNLHPPGNLSAQEFGPNSVLDPMAVRAALGRTAASPAVMGGGGPTGLSLETSFGSVAAHENSMHALGKAHQEAVGAGDTAHAAHLENLLNNDGLPPGTPRE